MKLLKQTISLTLTFMITGIQIGYAKGSGTTAVPTLTRSVSARTAGMADAYTAIGGDIAGMLINPAGNATLSGYNLSAMYQKGLDDDNLASILFGAKLGLGTLAVSIQHYDTGSIEMYTLNGDLKSETGQKDIIAGLGYSIPLLNQRMGAGLNVKAVSSEIFGEKADTVAVFDAGLQYYNLIDNLNLGLALRNAGSQITYIDKAEDLPMSVAAGVSYTIMAKEHRILLGLDAPYMVNEEETKVRVGLEYAYDSLFALRAGYVSGDSDDEGNMSAGIGFNWKNYSVDYAIGLTDNLDNPHHISLNVKF
ncbi:MAG: PorV/PorQ family protein [Elusimicrobia bacterium]|nr:PorV/PorQ family protein [Elusimicrobiota bacterium]